MVITVSTWNGASTAYSHFGSFYWSEFEAIFLSLSVLGTFFGAVVFYALATLFAPYFGSILREVSPERKSRMSAAAV